MRKAALLAAAAALACGCAERRLAPGAYKDGYAVEVSAPTLDAARRSAVSSFFELFLSSEAATAARPVLEEKLLAKAKAFIAREKSEPAPEGVRLRALVSYVRLGKELDALGLVRPEGVKGKPKILISLKESGPGLSGKGEGRASAALRRALLTRGFAVIDVSDTLDGGGGRAGSLSDARGAAANLGADVVIVGEAAAQSAADENLSGYVSSRARLNAEAAAFPGHKPLFSVEQEASALDARPSDAAVKALESAGDLAAEKVNAGLASIYKERVEYTLGMLALGDLERTRQFLAALRGLPAVAGAALDALDGKDAKLRLFVERLGADELTAQLLKLSEFKPRVRSVEPDFYYIEMSSGEVF